LARSAALEALVCGVLGLITGFDEGTSWKLGSGCWFAGGTIAGLLAIVLYLDEAADVRNR